MPQRKTKPQGISYGLEVVKVYLDGKHIGEIREVENGTFSRFELQNFGFQYFPKGQKLGGEIFNTMNDCKASIEAE